MKQIYNSYRKIIIYYEAELIATSTSVWTMTWELLDKGLTTKEHLMKIAEKDNADIIVMGYVGRKGPKDDPTLLGSAVEYMAHNPICPALVIKRLEKREDKESGGFRFLVCCDNSDKSFKALKETIKIIDKEKDSITILVVSHVGINSDKINENSLKILEENNIVNHTFVKIDKESDEDVNDAINDYINIDTGDYVDFVAISNQGAGSTKELRKNHLGKIAKGVLCKSQANVILCL